MGVAVDLDRLEALARDASREHWPLTCDPDTILALMAQARQGEEYKRAFEFIETLADGGDIRVNGIPWREAYERLNRIVPDPLPLPTAKGGE